LIKAFTGKLLAKVLFTKILWSKLLGTCYLKDFSYPGLESPDYRRQYSLFNKQAFTKSVKKCIYITSIYLHAFNFHNMC
jgi:hypothetical protein